MKDTMIKPSLLRGLRNATLQLKKIPGSILVLNLLRKAFSGCDCCVDVRNFDGSLNARFCLNEHMQSQIFWYGYYSRDIVLLLDKLLKPGMAVMDVGANIGEITLTSARRVGNLGRVYAFEPMPTLNARLQEHVESNHMTQVTTLCLGVSDHEGRAQIYATSGEFHDGTNHAGLGTLYASSVRGSAVGEIELQTLDQVVRERDIQRVDLIKIDIEGAELPALKGATETINRFHPYFIIEIQKDTAEQAGYQAKDILDLLNRHDYRFFTIGRKAKLTPLTADTLKPFQNVLCVHSRSQLAF
jgi:FkbM family methyltransferase